MGGGNLNLDEVQEPVSMLTAGCASHTSAAFIQNLRTSQSAIFWSGCKCVPLPHHPPSVRTRYSARVCVLGKTWNWP